MPGSRSKPLMPDVSSKIPVSWLESDSALECGAVRDIDVGTVAHLYKDGEALEVEFITGKGETVAVLTL